MQCSEEIVVIPCSVQLQKSRVAAFGDKFLKCCSGFAGWRVICFILNISEELMLRSLHLILNISKWKIFILTLKIFISFLLHRNIVNCMSYNTLNFAFFINNIEKVPKWARVNWGDFLRIRCRCDQDVVSLKSCGWSARISLTPHWLRIDRIYCLVSIIFWWFRHDTLTCQ